MKFSYHLWYLNAELVALAFFDPTLSGQDKSILASKVLAQVDTDSGDTEHSRVINPNLQRSQMEELVNVGLSNLITNDTIKVFERFEINSNFLKENPSNWLENDHLNEGLGIVKSLEV